MEKYKTILEDIEQASNHEVVKQRHISGMGIALIAAAILCAAAGKSFEDPNTVWSTLFFTASAGLLLAGVVKVLVCRSCYAFRRTKSKLRSFSLYFDIRESDALQHCVEMKRFDELGRLKREKNTGVKLEAMVAHDGNFAALQVMEYVPYAYEAVTPVRCYYGEDARALAACIKP